MLEKTESPAPAPVAPEAETTTSPAPQVDSALFDIPDEVTFELSVWHPGGDCVEQIAVSRDEYISVKKHVAGLRGLEWPAAPETE